ncbi:uncharacterized protein LOC122847917 [Aphidius gifuensis]|uniref:uncharacterized protein LOC122847917 n=1 Tax=Aphidius gifuensis TaxID=684658 RepID=UPI001CDBD7CA|nr:uncharacterized protein LOC122847917 [Aphidius gifuensis]
MSQEKIQEQHHHHVDEKIDLINTIDHDSLAQIFMLLSVPERMTMEKVCTKWEEACKLAWYDIKEYTFGESIGRFFDDNLLTKSYVEKLLSNFGNYLRDLFLLENCDSSIMPINIRKFKQLQYLSLSGCLLDDMIQGISETTTLVELSLLNSFVSEDCSYNPVDIFNQFVNLEYIDIDNPWVINTPNVLNNILNSSKSIRYCNIMLLPDWDAPDISIKDWDNLQNLEHLDSSLLAIAYSCENLQKLDISSCIYITEEALMSLTSLENLKELSVGNIDGVTDNFISQLKGLEKFFCEYCKNITDAGIIECIENCPELDTLNLYRSNITINTLTGADEITKNRTNNIALCIFFKDFAGASTLKIESNWLYLTPRWFDIN